MLAQRLEAPIDGYAPVELYQQLGQRPLSVNPDPGPVLEPLATPAVEARRKIDGSGPGLAPSSEARWKMDA